MLPLEGLRILAVAQYGAGPFAMLQLADMGAEVIKIEDPTAGGDIGRYVPPFQEGQDSLFYQAFNRNQRSLALDLKSGEGQAVFRRLVQTADVVFNNLRGDQPDRLGLTYEALATINPLIVCCSLTGFGLTGPRRSQPGYDYLIQGLAGFMSLTGDPDGPPTKAGISVVDYSSGFVAAMAILAGVHQSRTQKVGLNLDVSLFDTALSLLNYLAIWQLNRGFEPGRIPFSAHPTLVPSQNFPTRDGWIVVMCNKEKFWTELCNRIGRVELAQNTKFQTFKERYENRDELIAILMDIFREKTTAEWLECFGNAVPCAPVNTVSDALNDPQTVARKMVISVNHPELGGLKEIGSPVHFTGSRSVQEPGPALGQHTDEILQEAGLPVEVVLGLRSRGVIL